MKKGRDSNAVMLLRRLIIPAGFCRFGPAVWLVYVYGFEFFFLHKHSYRAFQIIPQI